MTRGSRSVHASASCASVWPRPEAISFSPRILASAWSSIRSGESEPVAARPRALGNPVEILVGEHPLRERREDDAADPELADRVEQLRLDPAVEHGVRRLMDHERRSELAEDRVRFARLRGGIRRDADVQRLAQSHRCVERAHRLLERRLRIEAVRVEDVHVIETEASQARVEAREEVLAGAPLPVRARPHVVARLARDDQLVAKRGEVLLEQPSEVLLGRAVRRPVVVREVEVRDAEIKRAPHDRAARVERPVVAEVLPEPERHGRKLQAAPA